MKFKIKRILAVMLVFCMMMGVLPNMLMTAHAAGTGGGFSPSNSSDDWNVRIDEDGKLTWNSKGDTGKYTIYVDLSGAGSTLFTVPNVSATSYELKAEFENKKIDSGNYHVYVATTNSGAPINSGTIATYYVSGQTKLSAPQNAHWDGTVAKWNSVTGATGYTVYLYAAGGSLHSKYDVTDTQRDFGAAATDGRWFEVVATAPNYRNSNAAESEKYGTGTNGGFSPSNSSDDWNVRIDEDGKLTWNSKGDTGKYTIYVDLSGAGSTLFTVPNVSATSYELKAEFENKKIDSGNYHVYVATTNSGAPINSGTIATYYVSGQTKLSAPQNAHWDGTVAKWNSVTGATGYTVYLYAAGGSLHSKYDVTDTQRDFGAAATDGRWFEVVATAPNYRNSNAAESPKYGEVVTPPETTYTVAVSASPAEGGTVTQTGSGTYNDGAAVTVAAIANEGYEFVEWKENGTQVSTDAAYTFIVEGNRNLVAVFKAKEVTPPATTYTVAVSASPAEGGTVTQTGSGTYNDGAAVTVAAIANEGYEFVEWKENGTQVSTDAAYTFIVEGNRNLVAVFKAKEVTPPGNTIINSVALTGFTVPSDGDNASAGDPAATAESGKGYTFKYGTWFDSTGSTQFNGEFEAGTTYIALLALRAEEGYEFAPTESFAATVNGGAVTVNCVKVSNYSRENDTAYVNVEFTIPAEGGETPPTHEHNWDKEDWNNNDTHHWHECLAEDCDVTENASKDGYAEHEYVDGVCACGKEEPVVETPAVELNKDTLALVVPNGEKLIATVTPEGLEGYTLVWSSSDASVATVDQDGNVTAVAAGTATITVELQVGIARTQLKDTCVVTVTEATPEITKYNATVNNGTGDGEYAAGEIVTITADVPAEGNVFDKWIVVDGTVTFTDATKAETTFTMPEGDVVVEATYKNDGGSGEVIRAYDIEVVNGKSYAAAGAEITMAEEGTKITIKADAAAEGKEFDKWVVNSGEITLADATKAETTFDMPAGDVKVTATYKDKVVTPPADDNDDDTIKPEDTTKPEGTTKPEDKPSDSPQTGDNSNMFMWIALLFVSGLGLVATVFGKKRFSVK